MEKLVVLISKIFPSNPATGTLGSIDLNLSYLRQLGVPLFDAKARRGTLTIFVIIYGFLVIAIFRLPYFGFEMYDLALCWNNLNDLTQNTCLTMMHLSGLLKLATVFSRLEDIYKIKARFEYMARRYIKSEKQIDTFKWNEFENKMSFIVYSGFVAMNSLQIMAMAFYNSSGIGKEFPYRVKMPENTPLSVQVVYITTSLFFTAVQIAGIDYLNVIFINITRCQLRVLNIAFDQLNEGAVGQVTDDSLKYLNGLVEHHNYILDIRKQIESVFRFPMLVQFFASLLIFALTGFQAMVRSDTSGLVLTYVYVTGVFGQLFVYCWFGNEVYEQNKTLASRGYETTWYTFDVKFRKSLLVFLMNAQEPFYFTAGGYLQLNLLTFNAILSKSYTYIAVLRQQYAGK